MKKFNDGSLMQAVLSEETGTLIFYGIGAVTGVDRWIPKEIEGFVRQVVFGKGITSIDKYEFSPEFVLNRNFVNLKKVSFFGNINKVGDFAFNGNPNLEEVIFHQGCRVIGEMAFRDCPALRRAVGITKKCCLRSSTIHHETHNEIISPFHETPLQKRFQSRVAK